MMIGKSAICRTFCSVVLALCAVVGGIAAAQEVVVGGKGFTEQQLIAELTSQLLAANGIKPDKRVGVA